MVPIEGAWADLHLCISYCISSFLDIVKIFDLNIKQLKVIRGQTFSSAHSMVQLYVEAIGWL